MNHPLQCQCGIVKGFVGNPSRTNHCVCYCDTQGGYNRTPFFEPSTGTPIVTPKVLSRDEREKVWH
jgi:hypothetical protein